MITIKGPTTSIDTAAWDRFAMVLAATGRRIEEAEAVLIGLQASGMISAGARSFVGTVVGAAAGVGAGTTNQLLALAQLPKIIAKLQLARSRAEAGADAAHQLTRVFTGVDDELAARFSGIRRDWVPTISTFGAEAALTGGIALSLAGYQVPAAFNHRLGRLISGGCNSQGLAAAASQGINSGIFAASFSPTGLREQRLYFADVDRGAVRELEWGEAAGGFSNLVTPGQRRIAGIGAMLGFFDRLRLGMDGAAPGAAPGTGLFGGTGAAGGTGTAGGSGTATSTGTAAAFAADGGSAQLSGAALLLGYAAAASGKSGSGRAKTGQTPRRVADLPRQIAAIPSVAEHGQIRILEHRSVGAAGAVKSWTVLIRGTQNWGVATGNPQNLAANLRQVGGLPDPQERAVVAAMAAAGIGSGEAVEIVGHSQGGIAAARVAADPLVQRRYRISSVVTMGAPNAHIRTGADILRIEGTYDPVPALDARGGVDEGIVVGSPRAHRRPDGSLGGWHDLESYASIGAEIDASPNRDLAAWRSRREAQMGFNEQTETIVHDYLTLMR